jgi:C_GCAxxG_C_C family probable redox protein
MFWDKKTKPAPENVDLAEKCRREAEDLYRSGKYNCAEAVMESIRRNFSPKTPESIVGTVSGFGSGSGSGCICGGVSGGTVALGLVCREKKQTARLTHELHTWFKEKYGATCCKIIRKEGGKEICPLLTGEVAGKIAGMLDRVRKED